jgi:hypothetical protein
MAPSHQQKPQALECEAGIGQVWLRTGQVLGGEAEDYSLPMLLRFREEDSRLLLGTCISESGIGPHCA